MNTLSRETLDTALEELLPPGLRQSRFPLRVRIHVTGQTLLWGGLFLGPSFAMVGAGLVLALASTDVSSLTGPTPGVGAAPHGSR